jgi:hypothetical protein
MKKINAEKAVEFSHAPQRVRRSFASVAIAVILAATIAGTALAATGIIDFGRFYNSIFSNPDASQYIAAPEASPDIAAGNTITVIGSGGDLTIEPVAGFVGGEWNLYIQLKLTALDGIPLPETLFILDGDYIINVGDATTTKVDERTAIISFRTHSGRKNDQNETISVKFDAVSSVPYRIDNNGNPDSAPTVMPGSFDDAITYYGNWEVMVSANNVIDTRFVDGSFEGRDATIRIEATVVEIQVFSNENAPYLIGPDGWIDYRHDPEGTIRITLADGRVIEEAGVESSCDVGGDGSGMASYWRSIEFVNPADVISVELYGVTVFSTFGE